MKDKLFSFLLLLGFAATICVFLYPSFMEAVNNITQTTEIGSYEDAASEEDMEAIKARAKAYNEKIYEEQQKQSFAYRGEKATDEDYESQLKVGDDVSTIAFLEIPKINAYLPITHGTKDKDLEYKIGHMYGTSLPIGGAHTHAVLAGHTGLRKADLFDHLTDMEQGDEFLIHVLDEIHIYEVDQINVVLPVEESPYLQVEDGDYITLYTCTPYGVNDHRLLVRGKRTGDRKVEKETKMSVTKTKNRRAIIKTAVLAAIPVLFVLIGSIVIFKRKKKNCS